MRKEKDIDKRAIAAGDGAVIVEGAPSEKGSDSAQLSLIRRLINETYTDEVEEILNYRIEDDGSIIALARDEDRIVAFKYTDEIVSIKILNPGVIEGEDDTEEKADNKYSHINFTPPESVQNAFKRALSATESGKLKIGSGMEAATKAWAKKLANGESVSPEKARQGYRWFKRNARFEGSPKDSPAWASWAYWGYSEGRSWFNRLWRQMEAVEKTDDSTPTKRILKWNDFEIGLQYLPFERRHGRILPAGYGHFRKTKGADGMAVDVYVGTQLSSPKVFVVDQLINGEFDEEKMIIGVGTIKEAETIYTSAMPSEMMGGIREISLEDLAGYRTNTETKADAEPFTPSSGDGDFQNLSRLLSSFDWATIRSIAEEQGWQWDDDLARYLNIEGNVVTHQQILDVTQAELARLEIEVEEATALLVEGDATVPEWEELIAEITIGAALLFLLFGLGNKQPDEITESMARTHLERQFGFLQNFAKSVLAGGMTANGIAARAKLYLHDAQLLYGLAQEFIHPIDVYPFYSNALGPCQSCPECPQITAKGIVPRGTLKPIGQRQCFVNCCCQWSFHKTQDERIDGPTVLTLKNGWL